MKTTIKNAFTNTFVEGCANSQEKLIVFLPIFVVIATLVILFGKP